MTLQMTITTDKLVSELGMGEFMRDALRLHDGGRRLSFDGAIAFNSVENTNGEVINGDFNIGQFNDGEFNIDELVNLQELLLSNNTLSNNTFSPQELYRTTHRTVMSDHTLTTLRRVMSDHDHDHAIECDEMVSEVQAERENPQMLQAERENAQMLQAEREKLEILSANVWVAAQTLSEETAQHWARQMRRG